MLIIYVACNTISDSILLYRCYVIWDPSLRVVIGPGLLLVVATASGIVLEGIDTQLHRWAIIYPITAITFNILVTSLTAGRIWWAIRQMKASKALETSKRYQKVFIFLVETGLIYPTYLCLNFGFGNQMNINVRITS
ncbi:hypothetical protein BDN72DRAFT_572434 [Pluteus cervinus]|uniref:Uncharacterized protein n=1 Tax=Pluteus cervinus TaxID=181527 RepID=A0ACD3AWA2_9AGAR|nr:hypothetical protein BDN72DRAFT_572434 [Pluteus cervinus]